MWLGSKMRTWQLTEAAYEANKSALPTEGDEDFSPMVRYMERLNVDGRQPASR